MITVTPTEKKGSFVFDRKRYVFFIALEEKSCMLLCITTETPCVKIASGSSLMWEL